MDADAKFMRYLTQNGWEGEVGEDDTKALRLGTINVECDEEKSVDIPAMEHSVIPLRGL